MPRHTVPNSHDEFGHGVMLWNDVNYGTYPSSIINFTSPTTIIKGNHRSAYPWWFRKEVINCLMGSTLDLYDWRDYGVYPQKSSGHYGYHEQVWGNVRLDVDRTIPFSNAEETEVYNKALSRLYDNIKQNDFNVAVFAGESPEMLKLKSQVEQSLGRLKNVSKGPMRSISYVAAGSWLAWQYAVKPVINDINALTNYVERLPTFVVTAKGRASSSSSKDKGISDPLLKTTTKANLVHKLAVDYSVEDPSLFELSRFGLTNPALVAWELIPFSFVVDWIWDVGSYLQNLEASLGLGLQFQGGYHTRSMRLDRHHRWKGQRTSHRDSQLVVTTSANVSASYHLREMNRASLGSFPKPRVPIPVCDLGSSRLLSAASLLRTVFLK